ncbi:hypothetical protein NE857_16585 [Nocardiopsis exhalans]|uniref:Uncharacterized protein n=1 Tax=Nocardiopsis exhalans TaxID=163604 RepID=A0ABY5D1D8_9ACTN|nr:hypothetical protein [Nocardiopsis exhalans]USY16992.1 hypothetical protein NE857_16585 [Nocardiopsis exhalans]
MASSISVCVSSEAYTEIVQVIRGGEPDEDGMPLAGLISPFASTLRNPHCACTCAPLPYGFWEMLDRLNPYGDKSDIWLRTLGSEQKAPPLPEGATLIDTRRVTYEIR